jgi:HlyD family secretion protein
VDASALTDQDSESTKVSWRETSAQGGAPVARESNLVPARREAGLPAVIRKRRTVWRFRALIAIAILIGGGGAGYYWWQRLHPPLPPGIAFGNGRLEANEINIDTKYAARIAEMLADQGDLVKAGQVVARMDTRDLQASLKRSQAQVEQARRAVDEANANLTQMQSQVLLAQQEFDRAAYLVQKGFQTKEILDQRQQQLNGATALANAAQARVTQAERALDAATHDVELYTVQIEDNTLTAPRDGRIEHRIANIGEVLPAGGHVFAMLDTSDVYMDIYLPTEQAGKVRFGADSRIVLDAYPNIAIPAKVTYIATQAQFTPKTVETQSERDKLMFRIRVQIDPQLLRTRADRVRSGLPGVGYVKTDSAVEWPAALQRLPPQ